MDRALYLTARVSTSFPNYVYHHQRKNRAVCNAIKIIRCYLVHHRGVFITYIPTKVLKHFHRIKQHRNKNSGAAKYVSSAQLRFYNTIDATVSEARCPLRTKGENHGPASDYLASANLSKVRLNGPPPPPATDKHQPRRGKRVRLRE